MKKDRPLSFSACNTFRNCALWWKYKYVDEIEVISDMSYAEAGSIIHTCIEQYYKDKNYNIKELFYRLWKEKKLDEGILNNKQDEYWIMFLNFRSKNIELTSNELKIFLPENFVGYLDGINSETDEIHDWKTSTRSAANEEEYRIQILVYSYLFYSRFGRYPKKCIVHYLKYPGSKGELSFVPTAEDIKFAKDWIDETKQMINKALNEKNFPRCDVCHHFCPYKKICFADDKNLDVTLQIRGNYIYILAELPEIVHKQLDKKFSYTLKDAHFIQKHRPNFDGRIRFYNRRQQALPIGFHYGIEKTLSDYAEWKGLKLKIRIDDKRKPDETIVEMPNKLIGKELRDYQQDAALEFLKHTIALLELPTGTGKTIILSEIIRVLKRKTLFVVDKVELMRQTKKVLEETLGIEIGIIGQGEDDIKGVTVATIQTLTKNIGKYKDYLSTVYFCIFDESHHCSSASIQKLGNYLTNTLYRCGASATNFRDDGNDMAITAVCGEICYSVKIDDMIAKGFLMKPNIIFKTIQLEKDEIKKMEAKSKIGLINETDNYGRMYVPFIAENEKRNQMIKEITEEHEGKKILILTKLVEHGQYLNYIIPNSIHVYGETNKELRKDIMKLYRENQFNILVSTISIFSEGIDIPSMDLIINAAANRGSVKSIQVLGRVLRKNEGKEQALYYDFVDVGNRFFNNASRARIRIFRQEGHNVSVE